jgi:hypothetical protein
LTRSTTCAQAAEWLNSYVVAQHPEKEALRDKWMKAKDRWAARAGWHLTAGSINKCTATKGADGLDLPAAQREPIGAECHSGLPRTANPSYD